MTIEEMRKAIEDKCNGYTNCGVCPLGFGCYDSQFPDSVIEEHYKIMFPESEPTTPTIKDSGEQSEPETGTIDHPAHYTREGAMECIDEMLLIFGMEAVKHFCLLNAWKYRYRAADKNGEEDLRKSDWYLRKYAELGGTNNAED